MKLILAITLSCFLFACTTQPGRTPKLIGINRGWLDSVQKSSDSVVTKKYGTARFATATYFINTKAAIICQVLKDSLDTIRQVISTKNNRRIYFAQFYPNGQLMAQLCLDSFGQYHGYAIFYYQNAWIETEGNYAHGFKLGSWKNNDSTGKPAKASHYNKEGSLN